MICRNDHTYSSRCQSPSSRAQKPRFCARNARKRGFRRAKAHKNADFVLEKPEIEGSEGLGAHGLCGRVANSAGNGCRLAGGRCSDTTHSANDTILGKIYAKKAQVKNVDYLSNEDLIQIARNLRKEFNIRYGNNQLNLEIKLITRYLNEAFCFSVNFVDDLYVTKPVHYLAGIDYENKTIKILNKILQFENRLRFTLIHELSHLILHKQFLHNLKSNREFVFLNEKIKKRIEIQANKLTSYILLPPNELKFELNAIVARFNLNNARGYYVYLDSQTCNKQLWFNISNYLCDKFGVSQDTLEIRLIEMDFLRIGHKDINIFRNFL